MNPPHYTNGAGHHAHAAPALALDVGRLMDGARLLVLGGTGFVGKVFWIMLLDRYPQIGKLYLLVRSSAAMTSDERFWHAIVKSEALDPLRARYAGDAFEAFLREKIVPIDGDVSRPMCGIDAARITELRGTIDAVVNVAGVVDFNPPLDEALNANAFGPQNLVSLARALGDAPLMHTSTCYVAGKRKGPIHEVDPCEVPFPRVAELGSAMWDPEREISECLDLIAQAKHRCDDAFRQSDFADRANKSLEKRGEPATGDAFDAELSKIKRRFVADRLVEAGLDRATHWGWPNIYTYTKSIGEQVIARSGLPFTIARPACCESTQAFPFAGWNEGISTSAPLTYLMMKGQVQIPSRHVPLDFIPTDMVIAGMIMTLAELLEGTAKPVYQYGASDVNPVTSSRLGELIGLYKRKHYQRTGKGNPFVNMVQAHLEPVFITKRQFAMVGPPAMASAGKSLARMMKQSGVPMLRPAAKMLESMAAREEKIGNLLQLFQPFTSEQNGPFSCANTRSAYARLSPEDRAKLPWEPEKIDFAQWMHEVHLPALEKYVLPEMDKKLRRELKPLRAHKTLVSLLDEMAERHDLALALQRLEGDGFTRVTYRDLRSRARAAAARLALAGVAKGDRVVLVAHNHPDWAIAYFGILCAGATVVPVDPAIEAGPFGNVVRESGARAIVWDAKVASKVADGAGAASRFDLHDVTADDRAAGDAKLVAPAVAIDESDIASLIFTSGTTGTPKGVKLTHANFTSLIAALAPLFPLGPKDRVLSVLPLHHTFEFTCGLLLPLSGGARIAYLDELNGDRLSKGLKQGRVTAMVGVPALWQLLERRILAQVKARGPVAETMFNWGGELNRTLGKRLGVDIGRLLFGSVHDALGGSVRYLISGGAALPHETQKLFAGLGLPLVEGYGLTEAAPVLTVAKKNSRAGQVGKAVPGVELKIHEPDEHGVGEVLAKGPNVMAGYTDAAATALAIDGEGWLHTGDLGSLDKKGQLSIVGRSKDVIVTASGENVYPDDLEQRLGPIEHIAELAVVGVRTGRRRDSTPPSLDASSGPRGESTPASMVSDSRGGERVACLAVPVVDESVDRATRNERAMKSLRAAAGKLPYGKQPAILHLYDAPLPRTATRKVKRNEVSDIVERLMAASASPQGDGETSPVRVAILAVRGLEASALVSGATMQGDLGFDSLALSELLVALEARFGAIDPDALQACRTVADVEALVDSPREVLRRPIIEGDGASNAPLVLPPMVQEAGKRFIGRLQDAFYGQMMKPKVTGRAFIPHNRNTIVVANHSSHLDMGFVRHALGTYGEEIVSLAAQDYFFDGNNLRRAFFQNLTNLKAIDRKAGLRQSERQAAEVLEQGKTMLLFPEGTRSPDGDIHEFKPLLGHLALTYGVDILPVFIGGTRDAMPKGARFPTRREITARIGPPLCVSDMRRLTSGMTPADASREVARLARAAVVALRDGDLVDLAAMTEILPSARPDPLASENGTAPASRRTLPPATKKKEHPLVSLFAELETKFKPGRVPKRISYYFTLGGDPMAKWTVSVDASSCEIRVGKPEGFAADCVLKTSPEIFTKIVRDAFTPGPADFLSGAVKSNDVELLLTFQKAFELG